MTRFQIPVSVCGAPAAASGQGEGRTKQPLTVTGEAAAGKHGSSLTVKLTFYCQSEGTA